MNQEVSYASQPTNTESAPTPKGFFSRLMGVYFSPGETFQEIGRAPAWVTPLLVLALVGALGGFVMINRIGVEKFFGQGFEQAVADGRMTQEQADQQMEGMRKGAPFIKAGFPVVGFIMSIVLVLAVAGLAKLLSMMFGVENEFKPLVSVTAYAMLAVGLIGVALLIILLYLKSPDELDIRNPVGSNVAALLSMSGVQLPKFLKYLLAYVDVFYIWRVVLLGIGYAAVSRRLKTSTAITYTAAVAVLFALLAATWGAVFG